MLASSIFVFFLSSSYADTALPAGESQTQFEQLTLAQLESQLAGFREEKRRLAPITLRQGVGNLGWQSKSYKTADHKEWVQIDLVEECLIDQIALVPILWRDKRGLTQSDGFPIKFKILIGQSGDDNAVEVASFSESDHLLPRVAPVVVTIKPTSAKWIRIEATRLSKRGLDGRYRFQLSEVMVFSGDVDVALGSKRTVSSVSKNRLRKSTRNEAIVDGFTPYLMTAAQGKGSKAYVGFFHTGPQVSLTFDLGKSRRIDRINLHSADGSQQVPQIHHSDYAMPNHLVVEGANKSDFSDAVNLFEYRKASIYDSGPIVMARFEPHDCQFVRLTAIEAYKAPEAKEDYRCIGFAEIEIFEGSRNVAAGIVPSTDIDYVGLGRNGSLSSLTDQRNDFGPIIPVRDWITQLARRHDLTVKIALIEAEVKKRYTKQSRNFRWAIGLIAFLLIAIVTTISIDRLLRARETNQLKERFAADLHDEVGADLHAIALLSDLAEEERDMSPRLQSVLKEIRSVSQDASASVRHVTDARTETPYVKLTDLMRQAAARIVIGIDHKIDIQGQEHIKDLRPQTRAHIFKFFKECLVNVSRHAEATTLTTTLKVTPKKVHLRIQDNGHGIAESDGELIPPSLLRRAKILGAKIDVESDTEQGTSVNLQFNRNQWNPFSKR